MKYGAHCYIFTERWSDQCLHYLDQARELGLDMFEISTGDDVKFDAHKTGAAARALGLELIIGPGGLWPLDCDLSSEQKNERAKGLRWHKRQVATAAQAGAAVYAGALYGHPGVVQRRRPPPGEYAWTADGLHELAEYAQQNKVVIALEPTSHFRSHLANTPEQIMRLIAMAEHPNLRVLFDTYHALTEIRSYRQALTTVAPRLAVIHACENDRGVPGGGLVPWREIFQTLKTIGFNGYIGLEAYNSSLGDFAYRRSMFHNVCPDGRQFVKTGLDFLRRVERQIDGRHGLP